MLTEFDKYVFDASGLVVIRNALSERDAHELRMVLTRVYPNPRWKFPVLNHGRIFWKMATHPYVLELSQDFCGSHFRLDHAFGLSSNNAPKQLHGGPQSSQLSCFSHPMHGRRALVTQLNFGFVVRGQNAKTGGFCYIPGSHKAYDAKDGGAIFHELKGDLSHPAFVVPELQSRDLVVFTEALIHGDVGWSGNHPRLSIYYKVSPGFIAWRDPAQQAQYAKYAETELEKRLIRPAWSGRYGETGGTMATSNERREPTIP